MSNEEILNNLEQITEVLPYSDDDAMLTYIHIVRGEEGAVAFQYDVEFTSLSTEYVTTARITPTDVGFHHNKPFNGYTHIEGTCACTGNEDCWYEGSGLLAQEFFKIFRTDGLDYLWRRMKEMYSMEFLENN